MATSKQLFIRLTTAGGGGGGGGSCLFTWGLNKKKNNILSLWQNYVIKFEQFVFFKRKRYNKQQQLTFPPTFKLSPENDLFLKLLKDCRDLNNENFFAAISKQLESLIRKQTVRKQTENTSFSILTVVLKPWVAAYITTSHVISS